MHRDKIKYLENWRNSKVRKPLLIRGARQVGKTWLVREFSKLFSRYIEINFERNPEFKEIFKRNLDPKTIVNELSAASGTEIKTGKTLLFLDEIQDSSEALKSLRYFYEELPDLHVIAAGSLLGFSIKKLPTGVGRLSYLNLYPMSFGEFLDATGNKSYRKKINDCDPTEPFLEIHHIKLLNLIRDYMLIGGMPAVVNAYVDSADLLHCQKIQSEIIQSYKDDFNKYANERQLPYLNNLLLSIPSQIGKKFVYNRINPEIRSMHFSTALELLETAGLVYRIFHTKVEGIPIQAGINPSRFKLIFFDVGLLQRMSNVDLKLWMTTVDIDQVNKGAIAEQFVGQELASLTNAGQWNYLTYWHREKRGSSAEVDYLFEQDNKIIPVEVKAGVQSKLKSLHLFLKEKNCNYGIKISKSPFTYDSPVQSIPFYAVEKLFKNFTSN